MKLTNDASKVRVATSVNPAEVQAKLAQILKAAEWASSDTVNRTDTLEEMPSDASQWEVKDGVITHWASNPDGYDTEDSPFRILPDGRIHLPEGLKEGMTDFSGGEILAPGVYTLQQIQQAIS